ncbi:MAG TPA: RNA polymerase subunit sigma-70 [Thermoanaerobaculia bacterium]|jgi:RNA polymerase sigma-70 factor (ECF subfamily)|nr:RNA polymerase subunit sigma-70 [Thermoanaerobaculia bacterium]
MTKSAAEEAGLVAAAATGDEDAFRQLVEPARRELHLLCYSMLGSFHDAEDFLQDAQLKAWRNLHTYDGRASFSTWMFRVVTNTCLDALRTRRRRVLPQDISDARDPALGLGLQRHDIPWLEPFPDAYLPSVDPAAAADLRESVRLAFVRAWQLLPPRQRAVLILREVFDWTANEVAAALGTSVAAVNSSLQRARATIDQSRAQADDPPARPLRDKQETEMAARYVHAWEAGDMDAIVSMLTVDALHAMPPWPSWFVGREALRVLYSGYEVWGERPRPGVFRVLPTALNGELAFAEYCREQAGGPYQALALTVATLDASGTSIVEKVSFVSPELFSKLGFPRILQ